MYARVLFNVAVFSLQICPEASLFSYWLGARHGTHRARLGDLQGDVRSLTEDLVGLFLGSDSSHRQVTPPPVESGATTPARVPPEEDSPTAQHIREARSQLALLQTRSSVGHQHRRLTLNHLAKCGGSFSRLVLQDSVPDVHIENEAAMVSSDDVRNDDFIIGLVRNPFDYYVSLWAFTSEPNSCCFRFALNETERDGLLSGSRVHGDTVDDRARFKQWLRAISADHVGVMSLRFYGSYLEPGKEKVIENDWHYKTARNYFEVHDDLQGHIRSELSRFSTKDGPVSCWVRTEELEQDLRLCLERYDETKRGSIIDFKALESRLATATRNSVSRARCSDFYDDELKDLVQQIDGHLLRAFQYPNGCNE